MVHRFSLLFLAVVLPVGGMRIEAAPRQATLPSMVSSTRDTTRGGGEPFAMLGAQCEPDWLPTFPNSPGTNREVNAMVVHDDGSGPALFVGGAFWTAGGEFARSVARWDGTSWSAVGALGVSVVTSLAVFDDGLGAGPQLFAGGVHPFGVQRWDGNSWSPVSAGMSGSVHSLRVHDDGSGPALFVGGAFTVVAGQQVEGLASWDGSGWAPVGGGVQMQFDIPIVYALEVFDDGGGPALYVGGQFDTAGGLPAVNIARWDGATFSPLGSGANSTVESLAVFDDGLGSGPMLYAGGGFMEAGGAPASRIARWNGASWSSVGGGTDFRVRALLVHDDGSGAALYAGGNFLTAGGAAAQRVAKWNGAAWSALSAETFAHGLASVNVRALAFYDDGSGSALYVGGDFGVVGQRSILNVARLEGSSWAPLGAGIGGGDAFLGVHDAGGGPEIYVGGIWIGVNGTSGNLALLRWDGGTWTQMAELAGGTVRAMASFDDGSGPALYIGGDFTHVNGVPASKIARWDGASWSAVGGGFNSNVQALLVHDDGNGAGPSLFAGGSFTSNAGNPVARIARWDGTSWLSVGGGMGNIVSSLVAHDDGGGAGLALYAAGTFQTAGGVPAVRVARWDGSAWSAVGSGFDGRVDTLAVHDDGSGSGPALYAGGQFLNAGGVSARRVARWDGTLWSAVGTGFTHGADRVLALASYDDGASQGPALYAVGDLNHVEGAFFNNMARWDGGAWTPFGGADFGLPRSLLVHDAGDGAGPALHIAGLIPSSPSGGASVARWGGCASPGPGSPYCFGGGSACPCGNAGAPGEGCAHSGGVGATLGAQGSASVATDDLTFSGERLLSAQPALLFVGANAVNGGAGTPFGDGLRCAGGNLRRLGVRTPDGQGAASWGPGLAPLGQWSAGQSQRFQVWYRDPLGSPCGTGFNLTNGVELAFQP